MRWASIMFVRSSRKSAGKVRYSVLVHRHPADPLSSRLITDKQFSPISTMVTVCCRWRHSCCTRSHNTNKIRSSTNCWVAPTLLYVVDRLGFFCVKSNAVSKASSQVKNIGSGFKISCVAFRLVPPYSGLLVSREYFTFSDLVVKLLIEFLSLILPRQSLNVRNRFACCRAADKVLCDSRKVMCRTGRAQRVSRHDFFLRRRRPFILRHRLAYSFNLIS